MMDAGVQIEAILGLMEASGVEVRMEHLGGSGGSLCRLRGKRVLFVDLDADLATRAERCVGALANLGEVDGMFLPPALRELVERYKAGSEC